MAQKFDFLRTTKNDTAPSSSSAREGGKLNFLYSGKVEKSIDAARPEAAAGYVAASALAGVGGVLEGIVDLTFGMRALTEFDKKYAESLFKDNIVGEWHQGVRERVDPNKAVSFAGDVAQGIGQSVTMTIPYVGPYAFFSGVIGQSIGEATQQTGELGFKEVAYGAVSGGIEGALEYVLGKGGQALGTWMKGIGGSSAAGSVASKAFSFLDDWAASAAWKGVVKEMVSEASGEFVEEFLSEYIDVGLKRGFKIDENASTTLKQAAYAGLVGLASGAAMGGAVSGINSAFAYSSGQRVVNEGNADTLIKETRAMVDSLKIDSKSTKVDGLLVNLQKSMEMYDKAVASGNERGATMYLGEIKTYRGILEVSYSVQREAMRLADVDEATATRAAQYMSYEDGNNKVGKGYTAKDFYENKNNIRTRLAAMSWAGVFLSDSQAMREAAIFDAEIYADKMGTADGKGVVQDIDGAIFPENGGTFKIAAGDIQTAEGDYMRVMRTGENSYAIGIGNDAESARGYRSLTREQAEAEFLRIQGQVIANREKVAQAENLAAQAEAARARADELGARGSFATKSERRTADKAATLAEQQAREGAPGAEAVTTEAGEAQIGNSFDQSTMNAARRAVRNFDALDIDTKSRILRWVKSAEGHNISKDVISGISNIMRIRGDLQVLLAETREGVEGFHKKNAAPGRNLIVLSEGKDINILRETIAHELGHEVRGAEGFDQIKKAALKATKAEDIKKWEKLYEGYPDAETEVAMKALGRRLATPKFIERYADRSMIRRIIDGGKAFLEMLRADEAGRLEIATTEKLIRMLNEALIRGEVSQNEGKGESGTKRHNVESTLKAKAFSEVAVSTALWEAMDHGDAGHDNLILMSQMPNYITENFGISGNLYLYRNHAYENMVSKEQAILDGRPTMRGRKNIHFHDIGIETMTEAIMSIDEPILTARVTSKDGNPTVVMALPVLGENDAPLCAVLSFYSDQVMNGSHEKKPHIVLTITPRDFSDTTQGRQGWKEFIESAINDKRILDYDKIKGSALTVTGQQTRLDSITGASLTNNIAQFKKFVNGFKEKNKINYNLTEDAAEQAAREAAEVEAFRNNEDTAEAIKRHQVEMYDREMRAGILEQQAYERMKQAQRVERSAEISRIETMARDYNDKYYKYEDVLRGIKQLNSDLSLKLYPLNDAAFLAYQELNMSRRNFANGDEKYSREMLIGLTNSLVDMSDLPNGPSENIRDVKNALYVGLRDMYEVLARQTPHEEARQRVEQYKEIAKTERAKYARYKEARDIERGAEIYRIETMARDYNEQYWRYEDVSESVREMISNSNLLLNDDNEAVFEVYRALNHIQRKPDGTELDAEVDVLYELIADIYEAQTGKAWRPTVSTSKKIQADLRNIIEKKAKQTPRDKSRKRAEYAEGQAKLKTLLDRLDRRRESLKKTKGSLANEEWRNLVEAAHRMRPRFELSYDGISDFISAFIKFAQRQAAPAVSAATAAINAKTDADAEFAARELKRYAEERQAGENQLLDFIDPRLVEAMLRLEEELKPQLDESGQEIKRSKVITPAMLSAVSSGVQKMLAMDSRVDKIFRNGRWEHVETVSQEMLNKYSYAYRGRTTKKETRNTIGELVKSGIMAAIDPEIAVHLVEGVFGDTTLSEGIHAIKMAYELARNDRDHWLKSFEEFQKDKSHKAWRKQWNEGEMTLKWVSYTIDGKAITEEITVTKQEAAQLYMTHKRAQARAALALGRIEFPEATGKNGRKLATRKIGVSNETVDKMMGLEEKDLNDLMLKMEQAADIAINDLERQFSDEDRKYIKMMEHFYNNTSKNVKKMCDTDFYGYTNVIEGYYVPLTRGDTTFDIDLIASRVKSANDVAVSGYGFNYSAVRGARSRLVIGSAQAVLERHAQQLSLYKNMTHPLQNIQRLYNYRQSATVDGARSVREFIRDNAWNGMDAYLSNYFKDVQGMRTQHDTISKGMRKIKGNYAKAVLGLNVASGLKQFSSFLQLPGVANMKAVVRGLSPSLLKSSAADLDKYSKLAENRHSNVEMYYAAGASGKVGEVGNALMKHLELGDRGATVMFWAVAQAQAEIEGKGAIGTETNKEYAGKLVDKWILLIQDTSAPTTKSALARHPQELVSAMTMFQSSAMKIFSRVVGVTHEMYLLEKMAKRTDLTAAERARVEAAQKKAAKAAATLGGTILSAALFESIIGLIRDKVRGNDDEEEPDAKRLAVDTLLSVMGTVPIVGGFAENAFSGYDITEFYTDFLNDGITAMRNMAKVTASGVSGEVVESEDILKALKGVTVFSGQLMGIPANNAMNIAKTVLNATSSKAAYRYEAMFSEPAYTADFEKAVKSGKTELAQTIYTMAQKDIKTGGAADHAVVGEMVRLYGLEYNVLPRSAPTSYEDAEGNTVKLKAAQSRQFSEIYGAADGAAAMVVTSPVYTALDDELKAKALRVIYEIYHSRAKTEVLGAEPSVMAALSYFEAYIDIPTLVAESAYIYGIKSTQDAKRSELVREYISGYSPEAQAVLLYAAGYRSEDIKETLSEMLASLDEESQNRAKIKLDF